MLNNNQWNGWYDLDYYHGSARDNSFDNPATGTLWADLDAGQIYGKGGGRRDICLPPKSWREG